MHDQADPSSGGGKPAIRGCRINVVQDWLDCEQPWDGVGEIWFDSEEAMAAAFDALAAEFAAERPALCRFPRGES